MKVLAVDDDPIVRRTVSKLVESFGHECLAADDGQQAWEIFEKAPCPVVVTDWEMPRVDGLELCRRIRTLRHPRYTYIIVLTGRTKRADLIQGLSAGADDFMTKPIDASLLQVRLSAAGRILRLEQELQTANQELIAANRRLQESSRIDPLMGIQNRLAFEERLDTFDPNSIPLDGGCGVVMCDIDRFKTYNDTYGHMIGDQILCAVADAVRGALRAEDRAYRFGGDEIVVLLRGQDMLGTALAAERLCRNVEQLELRNIAPEPVRVTISCGASAYSPGLPAAPDWEVLMGYADQALYAAKLAGRNRVRACWPNDPAALEFLDLDQLRSRTAGFHQSLGSLSAATERRDPKSVLK
jgi:two-component system chemotaxis response regulator CheY